MFRKQLWVNVYDITQHYGGPEEGGWYYDRGIPAWSNQGLCMCESDNVLTHWETCPIFHLLIEARAFIKGFKPGYREAFVTGDLERPEVVGEPIYDEAREVRVEETTGHAYPGGRPHYE